MSVKINLRIRQVLIFLFYLFFILRYELSSGDSSPESDGDDTDADPHYNDDGGEEEEEDSDATGEEEVNSDNFIVEDSDDEKKKKRKKKQPKVKGNFKNIYY